MKKLLLKKLNRNSAKPGKHKALEGIENIERLIDIDQSPIGRTPRSNPATYTGVFDDIRDLFAKTNEAKIRGYKKGRFSFNAQGGRCEVILVTELSKLKCTSCQMFTYLARFVMAHVIIVKRLNSLQRQKYR